MVWFYRILFVVCFMLLMDTVYFGLSFILIRYDRTHKIGIRLIAMAYGLTKIHLPDYCRLPCDGTCRNWTCPNFYRK